MRNPPNCEPADHPFFLAVDGGGGRAYLLPLANPGVIVFDAVDYRSLPSESSISVCAS